MERERLLLNEDNDFEFSQDIQISNINYLILTICIVITIILGINPGLILLIL